MRPLGPFEPSPSLAVAVSGGADSMALAILTRDWARQQGGSVLALVVDHGLRAGSAAEARLTIDRLTKLAIPGRLLTLHTLHPGPALAERARTQRYAILTSACATAGIPHLLVGHHSADQAETLAMRVLRGSQTHGLAGMPALRETADLRLLRPLLAIEPAALRRLLTALAVSWVEDPSNQDTRALRPRLRQALAWSGEARLCEAIAANGHSRRREERAAAAELARNVMIRPEGFALLTAGRINPHALAALIQTIAGAAYPPNPDRVAALAAHLEPATLAGVRLLPAGGFAAGMLLIREEAAIAAPVRATSGSIWDNRFRLIGLSQLPQTTTIGALGLDAARFRHATDLPSAVLRTLPALRIGETLASVPHLGYFDRQATRGATLLFSPRRPAAGAAFHPSAEARLG